jgi:uncharacterized membrane protein
VPLHDAAMPKPKWRYWIGRSLTAVLLLGVEFAGVTAGILAVLSHVCLDACSAHMPRRSALAPWIEVTGFVVIPMLVVVWGAWRRRPEVALLAVLVFGLAIPAVTLVGF